MSMNEAELGRALLNVSAAGLGGVPDARQLTWKILERDRRRVRLLAGVTVLLWLLAAAAVVALLGLYFVQIVPHEAMLMREVGKAGNKFDGAHVAHTVAMSKGAALITGALAVLALAALFTVALVLASRRATLRQINASLTEISEQLRQLRAEGGR
jgi:hypothetical protein